MAEGDFGDKGLNHVLLGIQFTFFEIVKINVTISGPYKRVLEPIRNVAARPVYQKWDQPDIYLVYYR